MCLERSCGLGTDELIMCVYQCRARPPSRSGRGWRTRCRTWGRRHTGRTWRASARSCAGRASATTGRRSHGGSPSCQPPERAHKHTHFRHYQTLLSRCANVYSSTPVLIKQIINDNKIATLARRWSWTSGSGREGGRKACPHTHRQSWSGESLHSLL